MMTLILLVVFLAVGGLVWLHGLWGAGLTLVNLLMAMLIATNLFEPVCTLIDGFDRSYRYLTDFVVLWFLFFFTFGILRFITDSLSRTRVKFDMPIEMAGRTILAIWCGWLMVSFTAFSLLFAPLNSESPLGAWASPQDGSFLGMAPERNWLGFVHSRSRGALARGKFSSEPSHPDDAAANVEAFDPQGDFLVRQHQKRVEYANAEAMRVP